MGRKRGFVLSDKGWLLVRNGFVESDFDAGPQSIVHRPYPLSRDQLRILADYLDGCELPSDLDGLPIQLRAHAKHLDWMDEDTGL